jgi:hypothetical protein
MKVELINSSPPNTTLLTATAPRDVSILGVEGNSPVEFDVSSSTRVLVSASEDLVEVLPSGPFYQTKSPAIIMAVQFDNSQLTIVDDLNREVQVTLNYG